MANAKKCDRCGYFYLNNQATHENRETRGVAFASVHNSGYWGYHDLCDTCQAKLDRFLAGCELEEDPYEYRKHSCVTCKYLSNDAHDEPCCDCSLDRDMWAPMEVEANE